jgi:hypothetical protein
MLRSPRVRPSDRRGHSEINANADPRGELFRRRRAASLLRRRRRTLRFHGRRSDVSDLWGTTSCQWCAHHRALSNGRNLAGDPRGLWRAQRGCDGLSVIWLVGASAAAEPSDQLAQRRSRASRASRLKSPDWVQRIRSTDDASSGRRLRSIPPPHSGRLHRPCFLGFEPSLPR